MERIDDLRRTLEPRNKNNLRVHGIGYNDQKSVMGIKSRKFYFFDTLMVIFNKALMLSIYIV